MDEEVAYDVGFPSERVEKEFYKILFRTTKREQERILEWFEKLATNPKPLGKSFKTLKSRVLIFRYYAHFRIREGDWRLLYDIDEANKKVILLALRRRDSNTYQ